MKILVTGSNGFVGRNLVETLKSVKENKDKTRGILVEDIFLFDVNSSLDELDTYTRECDYVVNLAGINRPKNPEEFYEGNKGFIEKLCSYLKKHHNHCPIIVSSSIQVGKDNDYAKSKKEGEDFLKSFSQENGNKVYIYRFANLFGKWCRPNYNSVTATWCHNIAHDLDIQVNDPQVVLPLCYIDDVVNEIIECMKGNANFNGEYYEVSPVYQISLGYLANTLKSFKESRKDLSIPNQNKELNKKLYATYLSYLPEKDFSYSLKMNIDDRGSFTEFIRTQEHGQVSINISKPHITKGNHWHHTKNEKFLVVSGTGVIRFRKIGDDKVIEYHVSGDKLEVIDIPTGYTHNIENLGDTDMVTVMWANEPFDSNKPDTYFEEV